VNERGVAEASEATCDVYALLILDSIQHPWPDMFSLHYNCSFISFSLKSGRQRYVSVLVKNLSDPK